MYFSRLEIIIFYIEFLRCVSISVFSVCLLSNLNFTDMMISCLIVYRTLSVFIYLFIFEWVYNFHNVSIKWSLMIYVIGH